MSSACQICVRSRRRTMTNEGQETPHTPLDSHRRQVPDWRSSTPPVHRYRAVADCTSWRVVPHNEAAIALDRKFGSRNTRRDPVGLSQLGSPPRVTSVPSRQHGSSSRRDELRVRFVSDHTRSPVQLEVSLHDRIGAGEHCPDRGAGRRPAGADDARGEGRADVPPADLHERRRHAARGRRRLLTRPDRRARRRAAPQPLQHLLRARAAAARRVAQPDAAAGGVDPPGHPGHDLLRSAAQLRRQPRRELVGRAASRTGPSRSASARSATRRRCASSATSRGRSTARSASTSRCTRWPTSRPSRGGRGSSTRSARTRELAARLVAAYIRGFQGDELGAALGRVHDQALPRRRPAEGRRGPALRVREGSGLSRRHVRLPPEGLRSGLRGRDGADHAVLRAAGRDRPRGGRVRLQPRRDHRTARASATASTASSAPTGDSSRDLPMPDGSRLEGARLGASRS